MPTKYRATLFTNGGSQAVRLPKECRLEGKVVQVWRDGSRLIVEPVEQPLEKPGWPEGFWEEIERNRCPTTRTSGPGKASHRPACRKRMSVAKVVKRYLSGYAGQAARSRLPWRGG
jgi:virulence-associated protein VagC